MKNYSNDISFISCLFSFSGQGPERELQRMKGDRKTMTTSVVGLSYYYSLVRYQEDQLERMK